MIEYEDLISDSRSDVKYNYLEITYQKKDKFSFEEISILLKYFIEQSIQKRKNLPTTIEFFLPRELFNRPIDTFIPKKSKEEEEEEEEELYPVGMKYDVSIRSYQRIKKLLRKKCRDEKIIRWQNKWKTLHSNRGHICCTHLISGDNSEETQILSKILFENILGVKLFEIPSKDILKAIDSEGIPVAVWLRNESKIQISCLNLKQFFKIVRLQKFQKK